MAQVGLFLAEYLSLEALILFIMRLLTIKKNGQPYIGIGRNAGYVTNVGIFTITLNPP